MVNAAVVDNLVGLRAILQSFLQHVFHVGHRPTLASLGKLQRDKRVEANAAGAEERQVVDDAVVERFYLAVVDDLQRLGRVHRQTQMARQSVARTAGNDAQRRLRVGQRACHFIDGTVATHGHHYVAPLGSTLAGQLCCVSPIFRQAYVVVKAGLVQQLVDKTGYMVFVLSARDGIYDESNALFRIHFVCKCTNYTRKTGLKANKFLKKKEISDFLCTVSIKMCNFAV